MRPRGVVLGVPIGADVLPAGEEEERQSDDGDRTRDQVRGGITRRVGDAPEDRLEDDLLQLLSTSRKSGVLTVNNGVSMGKILGITAADVVYSAAKLFFAY